jgi:hypothetical protein
MEKKYFPFFMLINRTDGSVAKSNDAKRIKSICFVSKKRFFFVGVRGVLKNWNTYGGWMNCINGYMNYNVTLVRVLKLFF